MALKNNKEAKTTVSSDGEKGVALSSLSMKTSVGFQRRNRGREEGKEEANSGNHTVFIMLYYGFLPYVRM